MKKRWYDEEYPKCPVCGGMRIKVVDTRAHQGRIWRRRECVNGKHRWNTVEINTKTGTHEDS